MPKSWNAHARIQAFWNKKKGGIPETDRIVHL